MPRLAAEDARIGLRAAHLKKGAFDAIVKEQATAWKAAVDEANIALE